MNLAAFDRQRLAETFRAIGAKASELPAAGFNRRVVSVAIIDQNDAGVDAQFTQEYVLTPRECNAIAVALAARP